MIKKTLALYVASAAALGAVLTACGSPDAPEGPDLTSQTATVAPEPRPEETHADRDDAREAVPQPHTVSEQCYYALGKVLDTAFVEGFTDTDMPGKEVTAEDALVKCAAYEDQQLMDAAYEYVWENYGPDFADAYLAALENQEA